MRRILQFSCAVFLIFYHKRILTLFNIVFLHAIAKLGFKIYKAIPFSLSLELSSICNLNCPQCLTGMGLIKRTDSFLSLEKSRIIIDQFKTFGTVLNLYFQGESLINPEFFDIAMYAKSKKLYTILSTNAAFIDSVNVDMLINSGVNRIIVSVDGATNKSYEKYRKGGDVDKVWKALSLLVEARGNNIFPQIIVQTVVSKVNENELNKIRSLSLKIGVDKVVFKSMQIYSDLDTWKPLNKKFQRKSNIPNNNFQKGCFRALSGVVINSDGKVVPCCFDKLTEFSFGNISTGFKNVVYSEKRNIFLNKLYKKGTLFSICKTCPYSSGM